MLTDLNQEFYCSTMEPKIISIRYFMLTLIFSLIVLTFVIIFAYLNDVPKIVFCDVGQGDGVYIRTPNKKDLVIDAGPTNRMAECLSKYMPFYDRTIEIAFLSHPQNDHYGGYLPILKGYKINIFVASVVQNGKEFDRLLFQLKNSGTRIQGAVKGNIIDYEDFIMEFYWPTSIFFKTHTYIKDGQRMSNVDLNSFSQVFSFKSKGISVLFTGDIDPQTSFLVEDIPQVTILKVPHHGSINGLTALLLSKAKPSTAIISVGKNNSFGHPSKAILDLLTRYKTIIKRTDREGDIIFKY